MSDGKMSTNIGCFTQLLCTKDSDWSSQDEWRLIGKANKKCRPMKIKSIYLGFDVSEQNQNKVLEYAKKKHFIVYKMNKPNGSKNISYNKIN